jgi:hypothetical protein
VRNVIKITVGLKLFIVCFFSRILYMENLMDVLIAVLTTSVFIFSGLDKLSTFKSSSKLLRSKINVGLPKLFYDSLLFLVILMEVLFPVMIIFISYQCCFNDNIGRILCYGLIFTVILSTITNYVPNKGGRMYLLKNIAIMGGLLALSELFNTVVEEYEEEYEEEEEDEI